MTGLDQIKNSLNKGLMSSSKIGVTMPKSASVADNVAKITSQDSPLMQQARTTGLQAANRRGLMNSSMAIGAAQSEVIRAATPIASQDAATAANAYESGLDRMLSEVQQQRSIGSQERMQAAEHTFQGEQRSLDRDLETALQSAQITAAEQQQIRDIESREGMAAAERALTEMLQGREIASTEGMQARDIAFRQGEGAAERDLTRDMQTADIDFRRGEAAADRELSQALQNRDIEFQQGEGQANRALEERIQNLSFDLQERIAQWNLDSNDRNAAAQFLTNMETMYNDQFAQIMANTSLNATQRNTFLENATDLRDVQLNFVEQMYNVELVW